MAIRTYKVTLDSKNTIAPEPVFLRQGDKTGAVVIDATLMDNGSPVSISGLTLTFMANTADGKALISDTSGFNVVNAAGGEFTYRVPSQLGSAPGKIKIAYFSLTDSSGAQSTFNVAFAVEQAADMTQGNAEDWVSNLDNIKDVIESIDPSGKLLQEVIDARGNFAQLGDRENAQDNAISQKSSKSDLIDLANQIIPGTPKEVFKNVADLKAKYPAGTTGIVVVNAPDGTGHWYYWDSEWKDGGVYVGTIASDAEILRISTKSAKWLRGQNVEAISTVNEQGGHGLNNFNVIGKAFAPAVLNRVAFYTFRSGPATVAVMKTKSNDIYTTQSIDVELVKVAEVTAVEGINFVDINMEIDSNYFIGVKCDGISYSTGSGYASFSAGSFSWEEGNHYSVDFVKDSAEVAISAYVLTSRKLSDYEIFGRQSMKIMRVINQSQPNSDPESYPITFDIANNKVIVSKLFGVVNSVGKKAVSYVELSGEYPIQVIGGVDDKSLPINYDMLYNQKTKKVTILGHLGDLNNDVLADLNNHLLIAGVSIANRSAQKTTVSLYSGNDDLVKVVVKRAEVPKDVEDVSTKRILESGLYNRTYVAVGDSITAGLDPDNKYEPAIGYRYTDIIGRRTGMNAINHGTGGATIRHNGENSIFYRISRIPEARCISIMGGTNDYGTGTPLGEYDDGDVGHHFKPAFDQIIQYLINNRDSQIVIITPINRKEPPATDIGLTLEDYVNVELEVAKKYGIPVLDLYHKYQWHNKYSERYDKWMPDGLHPSKGGYVKMAQQIQNFIVNVMKERI